MGNKESKLADTCLKDQKLVDTSSNERENPEPTNPQLIPVDRRVFDTSLPLIDRLRYALIGIIDAGKEADKGFSVLLEGHDYDKHVDNALKATAASVGIGSGSLGIAAVITGAVLAPVTGGVSLVATGLGIGALSAGGLGVAFHVGSEALYRTKLKAFNEQASSFMAAYNERHEALENVLEKINSNADLLVIKFRLERYTALAIALANPEEFNITEEFFGRISRNWIINGMLRFTGAASIATKIIGGTAINGLASALTNIFAHSGHLGALFKVAAQAGRMGAQVVARVAVGVGAVMAIADLVVVITQWNKVPPSVQQVRKVRDELAERRVVAEECLCGVEEIQLEINNALDDAGSG